MRCWSSTRRTSRRSRGRRPTRRTARGSLRDLTRYRIKKVQARSSEIQRLGKTLESAGIKLGSVASDITGTGPLEMIESLVNGERDGVVMAGLARGKARTPQKMASLSMALEGRFTRHHAAMCRLIIDQVNALKTAVAGVEVQIAAKAAAWEREIALLKTIHGFGDATAWTWIAEIGPAPHQWFATHEKLACWAGLAPGNHVSAGKRRYGRVSAAGTYIKPALVQAAWSAVRVKVERRADDIGGVLADIQSETEYRRLAVIERIEADLDRLGFEPQRYEGTNTPGEAWSDPQHWPWL